MIRVARTGHGARTGDVLGEELVILEMLLPGLGDGGKTVEHGDDEPLGHSDTRARAVAWVLGGQAYYLLACGAKTPSVGCWVGRRYLDRRTCTQAELVPRVVENRSEKKLTKKRKEKGETNKKVRGGSAGYQGAWQRAFPESRDLEGRGVSCRMDRVTFHQLALFLLPLWWG